MLLNFIVDRPDAWIDRALSIKDLDASIRGDPFTFAEISREGHLCWSFQSFYRLQLIASQQFEFKLSNNVLTKCINFVHSEHLPRIKYPDDAFIVLLRADYPNRRWAHAQIVQNKTQVGSGRYFTPLWPQAGLVPRDPRRLIERVAFLGMSEWVNLAATRELWSALSARVGLKFITKPPDAWHDFSDVDIAVGVRSFDRRAYNHKPASKLINAWHAGVPFIGGYDSAYRQVGEPGVNYLLAENENDVIRHLEALTESTTFYAELVQSGRLAAQNFSIAAIGLQWVNVIQKIVNDHYNRWVSRSAWMSSVYRVNRWSGEIEAHARALARSYYDKVRGKH